METLATASTDAATRCCRPKGPSTEFNTLLHRYPVISPALVLLIVVRRVPMLGDGRFQRPETIGIMLQQTAVLAALGRRPDAHRPHRRRRSRRRHGDDPGPPHRGQAGGRPRCARAASPCSSVPWLASPSAPFHGGLVTKIGLPPFIVTLGTFYIFSRSGWCTARRRRSAATDGGSELAAALDGQDVQDRVDADHRRACSSPSRCTSCSPSCWPTPRGAATSTRPATTRRRPASPAST